MANEIQNGKQTTAQVLPSGEQFGQSQRQQRLFFWLAVGLLTLIAVVMRFYRLSELPFGLHLDETYSSLDANTLLQLPPWRWPLFFKSNFAEEPLHVYLEALAQMLLGPTKPAVRSVPALIGVAVVPALVWLGWEIAPQLAVRRRYHFALWNGAAALTLLWAQMHARILVRNGFFLLFEILLLASFWRAWNGQKSMKWWVLSGIFAGLAFYTYLPVRLLPLFFLLLLPLLILQERETWRRQWRGAVVAVLVGILTALPLLLYFWGHPEDFWLRSNQVSIFSPDANVSLWSQVMGILGMAFVRGDLNLRMNYPLRPVLDIFTVGPFLIGFVLALRRFLRPGYFSLFALAAAMLLPSLLSLDTPNFGRAVGALPVFTLCIALGLEWLVQWGEKIGPRLARSATVLGYGLLVAGTLLTARVYFVDWAQDPEIFHLWDEGMTRMAYDAGATDPASRVYFAPQGIDHPTTRFLLLEQPPQRINGFDSRICVRVPTDLPAFYYFVYDDFYRGPVLLQSYLPDSQLHDEIVDPSGNVWAKRLDQPAGGVVQFPEQNPLAAPFGDGIALQGYWLSQAQLTPGQELYVRLFWDVTATPSQDYTAFVHLIRVDGSSAATQLAGADQRPGAGSCPTNEWLPREVVVDEMQFVVPSDLSATSGAEYYLEIGFYTLADGRRLDIPDNAEDRILIGPLSLPTP